MDAILLVKERAMVGSNAKRATHSGASNAKPHERPSRPTLIPGKLIVRFKPTAVEHVARTPVALSARTNIALAAMPDDVSGPLEFLKSAAGMASVKPLFVAEPATASAQPVVMGFAAMHRALARSATKAPRESLRGFQLVALKDKAVTPALLKRLRASKGGIPRSRPLGRDGLRRCRYRGSRHALCRRWDVFCQTSGWRVVPIAGST